MAIRYSEYFIRNMAIKMATPLQNNSNIKNINHENIGMKYHECIINRSYK